MQTWIAALQLDRPVDPRSDWPHCAAETDPQRGRKQAVEAQQIVMALQGETTAYAHHAVTLSWAGHVQALAWYGLTFARVFGVGKSAAYLADHADVDAPLPAWFAMPKVLGAIVANQRARLVAKERASGVSRWYQDRYPDVCPVDTNVYATQLLCPHQPGDVVMFDLRGRCELGRVVDVRPAGLQVRIEHGRGACWRRTETVAALATHEGCVSGAFIGE